MFAPPRSAVDSIRIVNSRSETETHSSILKGPPLTPCFALRAAPKCQIYLLYPLPHLYPLSHSQQRILYQQNKARLPAASTYLLCSSALHSASPPPIYFQLPAPRSPNRSASICWSLRPPLSNLHFCIASPKALDLLRQIPRATQLHRASHYLANRWHPISDSPASLPPSWYLSHVRSVVTSSPRRSSILIETVAVAPPSPASIAWCISLASNTDSILVA